MRKRLLVLVAVLALACSLVPSLAFSDEGTADVAVEIKIGAGGVPVETSGDGWNYDAGKDMLTLEAGHAFTLAGGTLAVYRTDNSGTIIGGTFSGSVSNLENATVAGGTFSGYVYNYGIISGGTFSGSVSNLENATVAGGTFNVNVNNRGTIEDGVFNDGAQNEADGTISGGTFSGMTFFNSGIISDGVFNSGTTYNFGEIRNGTFGKAVVSDGGTIAGGIFPSTGSVLNYYGGIISGGTFDGPVSNCDPDFDPEYNRATITGGTFTGVVTNYDVIKGGRFWQSIDTVDSGTVTACEYVLDLHFENVTSNVTADDVAYLPYRSDGSGGLTLTLALSPDAPKDYRLPQHVSVERAGTALAEGADYTYDQITGEIKIPNMAVTGPIVVTAVAQTTFVKIPINKNGEPTTSEGGGWTYNVNSKTLNLAAGYTFTLEGSAFFAEGTVINEGTLIGGTFEGKTYNAGTITGGTFDGDVINTGTIEGGFFAHSIVDQGGTVSTCSYPMDVNLTGLDIKAGKSTPLVTFEKDSAEDNTFTLVADKDYTLPDKIALHRDTATGAELVAGTGYTYNAATGTITIKKSAVPGPLYLVASGVPAVPPTPPKPTPLPGPTEPKEDPAPAETLAATGDSALPQITLGIVLLAGSAVVLGTAARRKRSHR